MVISLPHRKVLYVYGIIRSVIKICFFFLSFFFTCIQVPTLNFYIDFKSIIKPFDTYRYTTIYCKNGAYYFLFFFVYMT